MQYLSRRSLLIAPLLIASRQVVGQEKAKGLDFSGASPGKKSNTEKRVAFIIGCKDYQFGTPLSNTINDAVDMKSALSSLGFDIIYTENPSLDNLKDKLGEFNRKIATANVRLVYYSGHGIQFNDTNYLVPVDFKGSSVSDLKNNALEITDVLNGLFQSSSKNNVNLIILDACRNCPLKTDLSLKRGLAKLRLRDTSGKYKALDRILIAYAAPAGSVALDSSPNGRNGLYTGELLKHLKTPGLSAEQIFNRTRADVESAIKKMGSASDDTAAYLPSYESFFNSEFYFIPTGKISTEKPATEVKFTNIKLVSPAKDVDYFYFHVDIKEYFAKDAVDFKYGYSEICKQVRELGHKVYTPGSSPSVKGPNIAIRGSIRSQLQGNGTTVKTEIGELSQFVCQSTISLEVEVCETGIIWSRTETRVGAPCLTEQQAQDEAVRSAIEIISDNVRPLAGNRNNYGLRDLLKSIKKKSDSKSNP